MRELRPALAALSIVVGFIFIGLADLDSGVEIRVYPLYFLPLSLSAWHLACSLRCSPQCALYLIMNKLYRARTT